MFQLVIVCIIDLILTTTFVLFAALFINLFFIISIINVI